MLKYRHTTYLKVESYLDIGSKYMKFYIMFAISLFILGIVGAAYNYHNKTQKEIIALSTENSNLTTALSENEKTITVLQQDIEEIRTERTLLDKNFKIAQDQVNRLQDKLSKHELDMLAATKPKLVENTINKATNDINRCIEILSGKPLTLEEINATKPSEINGSCPDIANPNYIIN